MIISTVALLCGHQRSPQDPGVIHPRLGLHERDVVAEIAHRAVARLQGAGGLPVLILPEDVRTPSELGQPLAYHVQMERASRATPSGARMAILHLHCDSSGRPGVGAGPHQDRLVFYDYRSAWGKEGAVRLAATSASAVIRKVRAEEARPSVDQDHDGKIDADEYEWRSRPFGCIAGAYSLSNAYALLIELGNFAALEHDGLWVGAGLDALASWVAGAAVVLSGRAAPSMTTEPTLCLRHP